MFGIKRTGNTVGGVRLSRAAMPVIGAIACAIVTLVPTFTGIANAQGLSPTITGADPIEALVTSDAFLALPFDARIVQLDEILADLPEGTQDVVWAHGVTHRLKLLATLGEFEKGDAYLTLIGDRFFRALEGADFYAEALYPAGYIYVYTDQIERALNLIDSIRRHAATTQNAQHQQYADTLMIALHTNIGNAVQAAELMIENYENPRTQSLAAVERLKILVNIGYVLLESKQYERAERYIDIGRKELGTALNNGQLTQIQAKQVNWHLLSNYALIHIARDEYKAIGDVARSLVADAAKIGSPLYKATSNYILATDYYGAGDFDKAVSLMEEVVAAGDKLGSRDSQIRFYAALAKFRESAGDYEGALNAIRKSERFQETLNADQARARAEYMDARIRQEENNSRIQQLLSEKLTAERVEKRNQVILLLMMIVAGTLGVFALSLVMSKRRLKAYANDLRESERLAHEATQAKSSFLANMSHEIRTPLNGLMGMAQVMSDKPLDGELKNCVNVIVDSGQSLLTIVNDVLDLSKIEAGKMTIEKVPTDIRTLFHQLVQLWQTKADEKGVTLDLELLPSLDQRLVCDPLRLRQCVSNLVSNAIKFTENGKVTVRVGLRVDAGGHDCLTIEVRDTGIGIPVAAQQKLFRSFEQVDTSTTRKYGGSGLGLAITAELARLMEGTISVDSVEGHGSTFTLEIGVNRIAGEPRETDVAPNKDMNKQPLTDRQPLRLLLVDDNKVNRLVVKAFLAETTIDVVEAIHGEDALAKLSKAGHFDVVLLDMHMPVMDGPQTVAAIRQSTEAWQATPIITLTADAMAGDRDRYLAMGTDGYVAKPIDKNELLREVARVTSSIRAQHAGADKAA
ncbi:MAG: ATP-binding protein [Pseudomonadota bacterium]